MSRNHSAWVLTTAFLAAMVAGCASDDLPLPEAEVVTPGAFVAIDGFDAPGEMTLIRTLDRLDFQFEVLVFFTIYDVKPADWDEARELSKNHDLPFRTELQAQPRAAITIHPHRVVWFRTLTEEEQGRVQ